MIVFVLACVCGPWQEAIAQDDCCFALLFFSCCSCDRPHRLIVIVFFCVCSHEHRLIVVLPHAQWDCCFTHSQRHASRLTGWLFFCFFACRRDRPQRLIFACLARLANRRFHCCFFSFSRRALESPALVDWLLLLFSGRCRIAGWLWFLFCWFPVGCTCLLLMWGSWVIVVFVVSFCRFAAQVDFIVVLIGTGWLLFLCANYARTGYVIFLFSFSPCLQPQVQVDFSPLANFE